MNVLLISTSDRRGGAAIAASRLMHALNKHGVQTRMLVKEKLSDNDNVIEVGTKKGNYLRFVWERGVIFLRNWLSRTHLFDISIANTGISVVNLPEFKAADIIHLHWTNQGMLSLHEIGQILQSGKKVVWTMHDMWAFTGICHHARACENYERGCGMCPYLERPSKTDISSSVFKNKEKAYIKDKIHFVAVSSWLAQKARKSFLVGNSLKIVPNVIDINIFNLSVKKNEQIEKLSKEKSIIVMGAARLDNPLKGFDKLCESLHQLIQKEEKHPQKPLLVLFGNVKNKRRFFDKIPIDYLYLGTINNPSAIASVYRTADVTVVPSAYETFGQTIIEAMACGCPAVSFDNSGQADIIEHQINGYLAKEDDIEDFAKGIHWVLYDSDKQTTSINARNKVLQNYSEEIVAKKYINLYTKRDSCTPSPS